MSDRLDAAWQTLRNCLEARCLELHDAVRSYPTPIARCDEQLTRVIEQRDGLFRQLRAATELDRNRRSVADDVWFASLRAYASRLETDDDPVLAEARARLVAVLER